MSNRTYIFFFLVSQGKKKFNTTLHKFYACECIDTLGTTSFDKRIRKSIVCRINMVIQAEGREWKSSPYGRIVISLVLSPVPI